MVGHKGVLQCLHEIIDGCSGYGACEYLEPVFCRSVAERVIDQFGQLITVRQSTLEVIVFSVLFPFGFIQRVAQGWPEFFLVTHDENPAIFGAIELTRSK